MQKSGRMVSYTMEEIKERRKKFGTQTNWAAFDAMTEEELEASIDIEEEGEFDLSLARKGNGLPQPKKQLTARYDADIVDWFKAQGRGYQTKMNAVLRAYVDAHRNKQ